MYKLLLLGLILGCAASHATPPPLRASLQPLTVVQTSHTQFVIQGTAYECVFEKLSDGTWRMRPIAAPAEEACTTLFKQPAVWQPR